MKHRHELVERLLSHGAVEHLTPESRSRVLMELVRTRHPTMVETVLQAGANPNTREANKSAITIAAENGDLGTLQVLLRHGADVNQGDRLGSLPILAASYRNHFNVIDTLVQYGANIDEPNGAGMNPLMLAAMRGNHEGVVGLLARGANPNFVGQYQRTPLMKAAQGGHLKVVQTLLDAGANIQATTRNQTNALYEAIVYGHPEIASFLLNQGISTAGILAWSCLSFRVNEGFADAAQVLLSFGVKLDERVGRSLETALHGAARYARSELVQRLLRAGADVNVTNRQGQTPLMLAAEAGDLKSVNLFLNAGADASIVDRYGRSALRAAKRAGHPATVSVLKKFVKVAPSKVGDTRVIPF